MKAQTRRGAAIETGVNLLVGFGLTWLANLWIMPWFGFHPPAAALWTLGGVMTIVSIARQYTLRRIFERLRIRKAPPEFLYIVEEVAAERHRQISGEGHGLEKDDLRDHGELAQGAAAYVLAAASYNRTNRAQLLADAAVIWPWHFGKFRPTEARRDLVKSAAMIVAEIGRLDRARRRMAAALLTQGIIDAAEHDRMVGAPK
jgi:hypothetical protein